MSTFAPLWQFLALLAVHWLGDFVLQTHWQASNKSKRMDALLRHVSIYTVVLFGGTVLIFGPQFDLLVVKFAGLNGILHFGTDYFTSRWSSRLFKRAMEDSQSSLEWGMIHGDGFVEEMFDCNPAKRWHNFFVVIGFDQLIHQTTLAVTMWVIFL